MVHPRFLEAESFLSIGEAGILMDEGSARVLSPSTLISDMITKWVHCERAASNVVSRPVQNLQKVIVAQFPSLC